MRLPAPLSDVAAEHARRRGYALRLPARHPVRVALAVAVGGCMTRERLIAAGLLVPQQAHAEGAT